MPKTNIKNELIKRKYFKLLKEAEGWCESTINSVEKAICLYEDFTSHKDFSNFNSENAIEFKNWLKKRKNRGKPISLSTYHSYLRHLRKFYTWLCGQDGYRSKLKPDSVMYLKILSKEETMINQFIPRRYPTFEEVKKCVNSIKIITEVDQRDQALISFTALTGMRDKAIVTLPICCFDTNNLIINQNPRQGVQTKFSKFITSILFKFDEKLVQYVLDWVKHLESKGFNLQDPLFPRNKVKQEGNNLSFETSDTVEPEYWKGTGRIREIFKRRFGEANLPYYPPHTFRHLAIEMAFKRCENGEQIKAVSQNFGHENIATTFGSYANCEPQKLSEILSNIDFSEKPKIKNDKIKQQLKELVNQL